MPYSALKAAAVNAAPLSRRWVWLGGTSLALIGGYINAILLSFYHVPVSHMTGSISRLGTDLAIGNFTDLWAIFWIVASFVGGAALCGTIIGGTNFLPGRRYGVALMFEGGLLTCSSLLLMANLRAGVALAAMACGLQNAMASSYYGLILRTTHVSGALTDLGVLLGHWLRHRSGEPWKLALLGGIIGGFCCGGLLGVLLFRRIGTLALSWAAAMVFCGGFAYFLWRRHKIRAALSKPRQGDVASQPATTLLAPEDP